MLVLRAEDLDQAPEDLFSKILVDGLTLTQIIKHNEGILRLVRDGFCMIGSADTPGVACKTGRSPQVVGFRPVIASRDSYPRCT